MSVWKSDEKQHIFASIISPAKIILFGSNNKHSTQHFITRWDTCTSMSSKILRSASYFQHFSVFHLEIKHCVSCLINNMKNMSYCITILESWHFSVQCLNIITTDQCLTFYYVLSISAVLFVCFVSVILQGSLGFFFGILRLIIMQCLTLIRCPIWLHPTLSNATYTEIPSAAMFLSTQNDTLSCSISCLIFASTP